MESGRTSTMLIKPRISLRYIRATSLCDARKLNVPLMKLAIPLGCPTTATKWLVNPNPLPLAGEGICSASILFTRSFMLPFSRKKLLVQPVTMKKSLFIILAFALLGSGCSTVSLVYSNADLYLQHKINGYTSFNARQKETIHREVPDINQLH